MKYLEKEERPWGSFYIIINDKNFKLKIIKVKPLQKLSLQYHNKRDESWTIVNGSGLATVDDKKFDLKYGDSIKIKKKQIHRIENTGHTDLIFVETQTGEYFGEEDIVRIKDDYNRT